MANLLLEKVDYKIEQNRRGVWRRYLYPNGQYFAEFKTHRTLFGLPVYHYTSGICPETGRRVTAKGIIAIGRVAMGGLAIGQAAFGIVAIGQLGLGLLFGLGQASSGVIAIGQLAIGVLFGLGQFATGLVAIGQFAMGQYVLAQFGMGDYVWMKDSADPRAVEFFKSLPKRITAPFFS